MKNTAAPPHSTRRTFAPLRAIQRALLRQRIRWAKDQLELSAHYLEIEPIRHRWLAAQISALEVDLIRMQQRP